MEEKYLITGAGGFIGGWLAESLYFEGRSSVRAGIHRWSGATRLARFPIEIVPCDIMNLEEINRAMQGVTHVIHCAKGSSGESIINGTVNLLEAAQNNKVQRFIQMSTAEVYGSPDGVVDETYRCTKTGKLYGDSKLEAEARCQEYASKGLPVTILRPSIVYGPFSKTWILNIGGKIKSGEWGVFNGVGDGTCNLIYISDLVTATLLAARTPQSEGEIFNANGPDTPTWNDYFKKFNHRLGLPELKEIDPRKTRFKSSLMEPVRATAKYTRDHFNQLIKRLAANFEPARIVMKYLEQKIKLTPRPADLSLYNRKAYYSDAKIRSMIGYKPAYNLDTGLDLSVLWLEQIGPFKGN